MEKKNLRIALGLPMVGDLKAEVVGQLLALVGEMKDICSPAICVVNDLFPYDRARNRLVELALECNCDYLLFVDADTQVNVGSFTRLLKEALKTEAVITCGNILKRGFPFSSPWSLVKEGKCFNVEGTEDCEEFIDIDACGFPFTLIDLEFIKEEIEKPWFKMYQYLGKDGKIATQWEDSFFCAEVKKKQGRIIGVPKATCGHVWGRVVIEESNALELRQKHLKTLKRKDD